MSYKKTNTIGTVNNVSITGASVAGGGQRAYGGGSGSRKYTQQAFVCEILLYTLEC